MAAGGLGEAVGLAAFADQDVGVVHPLRIYDETGKRFVVTLDPSHIIFRAGERLVRLSDAVVNGITIPIHGAAYGQLSTVDHQDRPVPVPEQQAGVFYVAALPPAIGAVGRTDLLVCGPAVRDEKNRMIGCKGLSVPHHAVAAHPEPRRFRSRQELAALGEWGPKHMPWEMYTAYGLASLLFAQGLISKEEMDLAKQDFGDDWTSHTPRV